MASAPPDRSELHDRGLHDRAGHDHGLQQAEIHEKATQRLRRISQRYTSGRRAIVTVMAGSDRPLTIPEIVGRDGSLATSSVYRNLATLEQAGVVSKIVTSHDHARYELSEPFADHHHHLVCTLCGEVNDFVLPPAVEDALDAALRKASRRSGFEPDGHRFDVTGTCTNCQ